MSIDTWLTTSSDRLISLAQDSGLLDSLLKVEDQISAFRDLEIEDALDVLQALVSGNNQDLPPALEGIGIDAHDLRVLGKRLLGNLDEQDMEDFQLLLSNFVTLTALGQDKPAEQIWPLFDEKQTDEHILAENIKLKLNAAIGLRLAIQALADLPMSVAPDISKTAVLRLALSGQLSFGAGLGLTGRVASAGLSAQAAGSASIDFYFRHVPNRRVGDALLIDMRRLTSPFTVAALQQRLHQDNLAAIKLMTNHEASISGKVGFAQDFQVSEWVSGQAGATFSFSKSVSGEFDYLIHAGDDGNLVIKLKRLAADKEEQTSSLGLTVDMSQWAKEVYPQIQERLGDLGELLKDVEGIVPGQDEFRTALGGALADALGDFAYKEKVLKGLGFIPNEEDDLGELLHKVLLDKIESARRLWVGDVQERSEELKAELLNSLPVATDVRNDLSGHLNKALDKGVEALDKALEAKLDSVVRGSGFKQFVEKLNKLGHQVQGSIRAVDARIAAVKEPVKEELDNLQKRINELKALFNDASKAKISMTFSSLFRKQDSDSLDLCVVLNPEHEDAQAVLDALITADMDGVFQRIVNSKGELEIDRAGAIVSASGTFVRYASILDEKGFTTILFGYGLSGKTSISADAKLVVDAHGNIQVLSKAEYKKQYKSFHDDRELQIIDVMELATAKQTRSISLATNLSMTDEDLTPKEAWEFFSSAEDVGLLVPGTADRAKVHLNTTNLKSGRLDVGMSLTNEQLLRLLAIDKPGGTLEQQTPVDAEWVFKVARENTAEICTRQPPSMDLIERLGMLRGNLTGFGVDVGDDLENMIACMTRKKLAEADKWLEHIHENQPHEIANSSRALSWVRARYVAVNGCHGSCSAGERPPQSSPDRLTDGQDVGDTQNEQSGLLDAIKGMREAYFSQAVAEQWDVTALRQQQRKIGMAFKPWFVWQGDFPRWWMLNTKEIRPLTLSFFRTLGELSQPPGEARPMLSAALTLKGPRGEDKKRIPLT